MIEFDPSDNVTLLPVRFKEPPGEDTPFLVIEPGRCAHFGPFVIDHAAEFVTCKRCGERLNPMFVLHRLAMEETRWHRARETYQDEMRRLEERSRTRCDHCGKMTRIGRGRR